MKPMIHPQAHHFSLPRITTALALLAWPLPASTQDSATVPGAPQNLTAVVNDNGSVTLSWDAPGDDAVTGYRILRRRPTEGENTLLEYVGDTDSTATTFTDTEVTAGIQHVYRVKAINSASVGEQSNHVNVTPPAPQPPAKPTNLTGTVAHDRVSLTWDNPEDDSITGYQVLRRDTTVHRLGEFVVLVDDTGTAETAYVDSDVAAGGNYVYRVKARNAAGLSPRSSYFDAQVPQPPAVTVSFEQGSYAVAEGASVAVTVLLDTDPDRDVSIPIVAAGQGGASDADHSSVPSAVTFTAGETRQVIIVTATDDAADDDGESVLLQVGAGLPDRVSAGIVNETTVSITDNDDPEPDPTPTPEPEPAQQTDKDATWEGAVDLGDITELTEAQFPKYTINGDDDQVDYFSFSLTEPKRVSRGLKQLDFDADLVLEDSGGATLRRSQKEGTDNEAITRTMLEGTYYIRVEAQEEGENQYVLKHGVAEPDPDKVRKERERTGEVAQVTVSFKQASYDVAEGSTATVKIVLDQDPGRSLTIPLTSEYAGGAADADLSQTLPTSVAFDSGETTTSFTFTVESDDEDEDGEGIKVGFDSDSLPDGVTVGTPAETTVNFIDDDVPATEPPAAPTGLNGAVSHDAVVLTWDDPQDDTVTGYQILRRDKAVDQPGEFTVHVDDTGSAATTYVDIDVAAGARYAYRTRPATAPASAPGAATSTQTYWMRPHRSG